MAGEDVEEDLRVLRDAKNATHRIFNTQTKKLEEVPDHKTRLAATTLSRAYHEGKPVERSVTAHVDTKDWPATLAALAAESPAFLEAEAEIIQKPSENPDSDA